MHTATGVTQILTGVIHVAPVVMQFSTVVMRVATGVSHAVMETTSAATRGTHAAMVVMREETVVSPLPADVMKMPAVETLQTSTTVFCGCTIVGASPNRPVTPQAVAMQEAGRRPDRHAVVVLPAVGVDLGR